MIYLFQQLMLLFLRHAERGDNEFPQQTSQISFDPPINSASNDTISRTAQQLLQVFKKNQIMSVNFLRCLMTAQTLIEHLKKGGIVVNSPLLINNQIGQYMREDWFSEYPLKDKLIYDSEHRNKYLKTNEWQELKLKQKLPFPQNYVMFHHRIGRFKQKLQFPLKGSCTLIITHGLVVREMCWRMNQVPSIMAQVPYCGYAAFVQEGKQELLVRARL